MARKSRASKSRSTAVSRFGVAERGEDRVSEALIAAAPYLAPWGLTLAAGASTEAAHLYWGGDPTTTPVVSIVLAGAGAALTTYVHKTTAADRARHALNTATAGALTLGTTTGLIAGMDGTPLSAWLLGGVVLSAAHNIRRHMGRKERGAKTSKWARLEETIGLERFKVQEVRGSGKGVVTVDVSAEEGATASQFVQRLESLGTSLRLGKGRMTATVDPDDSSQITLRAVVEDLLRDPLPWGMPEDIGQSIGAGPLTGAAIYEDGEDVPLNPTGCPKDNVEHLITQGTNGAGKTLWIRNVITEALTRTEVSVIILDASKPDQDYGCVRHGAEMFLRDEGPIRKFFALTPSAIKARANYLGAKGIAKWRPGCGLNFLIVVAEEAADFAASSAAYVKMLRTARSVGIWIISSFQRATADNIDTTARANHPAAAQFGMTDGGDASFIMPADLLAQGIDCEWGNRKAGRHYIMGLGTEEKRWSMPARSRLSENRILADVITATAHIRTPLDEVTAKAYGGLWTNREIFTTPLLEEAEGSVDASLTEPDAFPQATRTEVTPTEAAPFESGPPEIEMTDMDEEAIRAEVADLEDMVGRVQEADPEPNAYTERELEEVPPAEEAPLRFDSAASGRTLQPPAAIQALRVRLNAMFDAGEVAFKPGDLQDIWLNVAVRDPRRWFYRQRDRLISEGFVTNPPEEYGVYMITQRLPEDWPSDNSQ
ncbi:hypothetical protein [Embleya sp. NPDC005575]|uniref:hypothetical protein n=1 Tax=Embleya sp. NPDC005575 TaxID=3156892 RepID=UPI0033AE2CA5